MMGRLALNYLTIAFILILLTINNYCAHSIDDYILDIVFNTTRATQPNSIIPGDLVNITFNVYTTTLPNINVTISYIIYYSRPSGARYEVLSSGEFRVLSSSNKASHNITIQIPWTREVMVEAQIISPVVSKKIESKLEVSPETKISVLLGVGGYIGDVREGGWLIIPVRLVTNTPGEHGLLRVTDTTLGVILREMTITLIDGYTYEVYVRVPENPRRLLIFKDLFQLRRIIVEFEGLDTYKGNNYDVIYATVIAPGYWRIPWFIASLIGLVTIIILVILVSKRIFV
ncbi:MAG: hypothetical protein QXO93_06375 [Acidilobaceae archaeon]